MRFRQNASMRDTHSIDPISFHFVTSVDVSVTLCTLTFRSIYIE